MSFFVSALFCHSDEDTLAEAFSSLSFDKADRRLQASRVFARHISILAALQLVPGLARHFESIKRRSSTAGEFIDLPVVRKLQPGAVPHSTVCSPSRAGHCCQWQWQQQWSSKASKAQRP